MSYIHPEPIVPPVSPSTAIDVERAQTVLAAWVAYYDDVSHATRRELYVKAVTQLASLPASQPARIAELEDENAELKRDNVKWAQDFATACKLLRREKEAFEARLAARSERDTGEAPEDWMSREAQLSGTAPLVQRLPVPTAVDTKTGGPDACGATYRLPNMTVMCIRPAGHEGAHGDRDRGFWEPAPLSPPASEPPKG